MNQCLLRQKLYGYSATPLILPYDSSHSVDDHIISASDSKKSVVHSNADHCGRRLQVEKVVTRGKSFSGYVFINSHSFMMWKDRVAGCPSVLAFCRSKYFLHIGVKLTFTSAASAISLEVG